METTSKTPNTYAKYAANVFVAKCADCHDKGETIIVETKHGKEHECIVFLKSPRPQGGGGAWAALVKDYIIRPIVF